MVILDNNRSLNLGNELLLRIMKLIALFSIGWSVSSSSSSNYLFHKKNVLNGGI
ncbi:MAG: hypothetical protein ACP5NV_06950 [Candidatus Woesearchaeota archaeon]